MTEQNFVYVDANYLKELEETAKKVDYYKGIIDGINMVIDRKTEPTISKMEQVETDINVGRKDEPQTEYKKWETKPSADRPTVNTTCVGVAMTLIEDEPQTEDPKPISLYDSQRDYDYDLALDKMDCPWK